MDPDQSSELTTSAAPESQESKDSPESKEGENLRSPRGNLDTTNSLLHELIDKIDRQNQLIQDQLRQQSSIRERVLMGMWTGFGTVVGATVIVSVAIYGLKTLSNVQIIRPIINQVIDDLETRGRIIPQPKNGETKEPVESTNQNQPALKPTLSSPEKTGP